MIRAYFVLILYCESEAHDRNSGDKWRHRKWTYYGGDVEDCENQARKDGWHVKAHIASETVMCPNCAKREKDLK